jgi:hypothetical protein
MQIHRWDSNNEGASDISLPAGRYALDGTSRFTLSLVLPDGQLRPVALDAAGTFTVTDPRDVYRVARGWGSLELREAP